MRSHSRYYDINGDTFKILTFISIFHKYDMFTRIGKNHIATG